MGEKVGIGLNKKSIQMVILLLLIVVLLVACTNRSLVKKKDEEETGAVGEKYGFTMLHVSFDTSEMKEALVSRYDEKVDKTEAVYENNIDAVFLHGDKAMEKLDQIFTDLELDPEMDDEDMIKEASKAFEVMDYKSLKLEVTFKGHDTKQLMMKK